MQVVLAKIGKGGGFGRGAWGALEKDGKERGAWGRIKWRVYFLRGGWFWVWVLFESKRVIFWSLTGGGLHLE